jgi:hypothetical protein
VRGKVVEVQYDLAAAIGTIQRPGGDHHPRRAGPVC